MLTQIAVKLELIHTFAPAKDGLMPPITEFLEARIAEDEEVAMRNSGERGIGDGASWPDYQTYVNVDTDAADDYLKQFHPARILAECAAKRAIIEQAAAIEQLELAVDEEWGRGLDWLGREVLLTLAAVYSDHPDYQQEWARG